MRAVVYENAERYEVREVPTPEPGAGQVRIRVVQAGFCGTDLHIHHGGFGAAFPLIPGHEVVGVVDALGEGVSRFRVGEQVTVNPNLPCHACAACLEGRLGQCESCLAYGVQLPGFFAEYAVVEERQTFSVDGLDPDLAVVTEPAACAMHGVETLAPRPGSTALVLGAGPTGVLLAQLLKHSGCVRVTVAAPTEFKLDTAAQLGVDQTVLLPRGDTGAAEKALRAAAAHGYDYVVEATGSVEVAELCVPLTRSGGTVLIYGVMDEDARMRISPFDIFRREITIKGSFAEMTSFPAAIRALRGGRVSSAGLITHRFTLDEWPAALSAATNDRSAHKIVITP